MMSAHNPPGSITQPYMIWIKPCQIQFYVGWKRPKAFWCIYSTSTTNLTAAIFEIFLHILNFLFNIGPI